MPQVAFKNDGAMVDQFPQACPYCRYSVSALYISALRHSDRVGLDVIFSCPRNSCQRVFVGCYAQTASNSYGLRSEIPVNPVAPAYPQEVEAVSPQFATIFSQASKAEAYGLDAIAGVGYRKALEFLIKDYCCSQHSDKQDDIKARPLAQVINNFVDNENIKQCAKRAVWLGNDETHYVRTWADRDVQDLKLVIKLTVNWIEQALITARLLEEMDRPR